MLDELKNIWHGGQFLTVSLRTIEFVVIAVGLSLLVGYPVAYYTARHAGRWKGLSCSALILPLWINYLMRMLAWINLLAPDGLGTRVLHTFGIEKLFLTVGLLAEPGGWLNGQPTTVILALVYGYLPFFILPLFVAIDRIDGRQIEAARDLGASPLSAFLRVTLPLSVPGILAGAVLIALPMFGDYYTADLVSASTQTNMIGNQIDEFMRQGSEKVTGAALTLLLSLFLLALMFYYLRTTAPGGHDRRRGMSLAPQSLGPAALLALITGVYILWSVVPVLLAIAFAFNNGRSRTTWQGFSFRWFTGPTGSVLHDPALQDALEHTLLLAVICVAVADAAGRRARPRAAALARPRRRHGQLAHAAAARDAGDRDGRRAAAALPARLPGIGLGTEAQVIGQVTFTLSYVVVIVRGRLVSIGPEYEEAAADLGAPPRDQLLPRPAAAARAGDRGSAAVVVRDLDRRLRRHRSTCRATRARRPCRCCSTRARAARRLRRSTRSPPSGW